MDIVTAIKNLNKSIEDLTKATREIADSQKIIDDVIKNEIELKRKEAEELLSRIKL